MMDPSYEDKIEIQYLIGRIEDRQAFYRARAQSAREREEHERQRQAREPEYRRAKAAADAWLNLPQTHARGTLALRAYQAEERERLQRELERIRQELGE